MSIRTCPHCDSPIALHLTRCNYCNGKLEAPVRNPFQSPEPPPPESSQSWGQRGQAQQPKVDFEPNRQDHWNGQGQRSGQYPPQGQYQSNGQYPPHGQYPPNGQYPPQGQYQTNRQYPPHGQYPPNGQYPPQGQYQSNGQYPPHGNFQSQNQAPPPYNQGYGQPYGQPYMRPYYRNPKSKLAAGLLGIFLGGFGIHKFYLGRYGWGVIYLLLCWTYIPAVLGFIEGIVYLLTPGEHFHRKYSR